MRKMEKRVNNEINRKNCKQKAKRQAYLRGGWGRALTAIINQFEEEKLYLYYDK